MESICTTPARANDRAPSRKADVGPRAALPLVIALFALTASGCSIIFPPDGCASTAEMCPDLECPAGFLVNDDGCAMCECAAVDREPEVCWDDADCASDKRCDVESFCEAPPGCVEGEPCPAVCYGRCVSEPDSCVADGDCGDGERCVFDGGPAPTAPAPPPDEDGSGDRACEPDPDGGCVDQEDPNQFVQPTGVCLPESCEERPDLAPPCPDGSVLVMDFSQDPCGVLVCVDVDDCRSLEGDVCSQTPGCRLEEVPTPCAPCRDGEACEPCEPALVCVSDDATCEDLAPEECELHGECELVFDGGAAPCFEECDSDGNCTGCTEPAPPPDQEGRCVTRTTPSGECRSDVDCGEGQVCEILDECGSSCQSTPNGDIVCEDVCVVIGVCADVPPSPACELDADCGPGYLCEQTEVCSCDGGGSGGSEDPPEGGAPAPCFQVCELEGQCVWNDANVSCWGDLDCGAEQHCAYLDNCVAPPDCVDCLVACEGVCVDNEPETVSCLVDDECGSGQVCNTVDYCDAAPGCNEDGTDCPAVCYGRCVEPEPAPSDKCLEEADCGEGLRCASEVDSCYCPEGETCDVCYWQCVPEATP